MRVPALIIPTHERAEGTVETILAMGEDIEMLVSDTIAKNAWDAIVHPPLKVVRPTPGISIVDIIAARPKPDPFRA